VVRDVLWRAYMTHGGLHRRTPSPCRCVSRICTRWSCCGSCSQRRRRRRRSLMSPPRLLPGVLTAGDVRLIAHRNQHPISGRNQPWRTITDPGARLNVRLGGLQFVQFAELPTKLHVSFKGGSRRATFVGVCQGAFSGVFQSVLHRSVFQSAAAGRRRAGRSAAPSHRPPGRPVAY
jgi:hypothetical protein